MLPDMTHVTIDVNTIYYLCFMTLRVTPSSCHVLGTSNDQLDFHEHAFTYIQIKNFKLSEHD